MLKRILRKILPKEEVRVSAYILGAQKSGTTSLHSYLIRHPEVYGARTKEIHYFSKPGNFAKGEGWYHSRFDPVIRTGKPALFLDSSPIYLYLENVPERIAQYNPEARHLVMLREPVSRAYSQWNMFRELNQLPSEQKELIAKNHGRGNTEADQKFLYNLLFDPYPSFEEMALNDITSIENGIKNRFGLIARGFYVEQLERYFRYFDRKQFLIIESSSFRKNPMKIMEDIYGFLGVPGVDWKEIEFKPQHERQYEDVISPEIEHRLKEYYNPYNESLFQLLGREYDW